MSPSRSLARQLTTGTLVAALAPVTVLAALSFWQYQRDVAGVEGFIADEATAAARSGSTLVDATLDGVRSTLKRLAREAAAGRITAGMLQAELREQPQIQSLVLTDATGRVLISDRQEAGPTVSAATPLKRAVAENRLVYSDVYRSPTLGTEAVAAALPVVLPGGKRGAVMARMSIVELNRQLSARLAGRPTSTTYVADAKGILIAHPDPTYKTGMDVSANPPVAAGLAGKQGATKYESTLYGVPRIGAAERIADAGWVVVSARETGDQLVNVADRLRNHLLVALLAGLAALFAAFAWSRRLTRPLEAMVAGMRRAREERHGTPAMPQLALAPVPVAEGIEEYELLGRSYNDLVAELNRRFEEVMALTEEVQAQNEELQSQNEEIQAQAEEVQSQSEELSHQNMELERLSSEAMAANRMKSEFLANMSHELRTPLNSIIGYTELVLHNKKFSLPEKALGHLGIVVRNARNLLSLINDILDLSKVESGQSVIYTETFQIKTFVHALVATTEPLASERGIDLLSDVAPDVGAIATDEAKLRQVLLNLVANAVKFTKQGHVAIAVRRVGSDRIAFEVSDTGVGIPEGSRDLIFEEFRQVDGSTTREAGGTGLGLPIARKLARLLGGDVVLARSAPGQGSAFVVELPIGDPAQPADLAAPDGVPAAGPIQAGPGERLVVAIDDDPEMLQLLVERLQGSSYKVVPASSGESGLKLVKELAPYAITLDVMMPGMDGWMVLRALKQDPETREVPVVVVSFVDNKLLGFNLGASAYLTKPVEPPELLGALDRLGAELRRSKGHVLVVDDDPHARGLYGELLASENIRYREAGDGREAIAAIEAELPALVILDLMMPHMDGFEVVAWLREHPRAADVPVIIVTAKTLTPEDLNRLTNVERVIAKGDSAGAMLVDDLRALLDRSRGRTPEEA